MAQPSFKIFRFSKKCFRKAKSILYGIGTSSIQRPAVFKIVHLPLLAITPKYIIEELNEIH